MSDSVNALQEKACVSNHNIQNTKQCKSAISKATTVVIAKGKENGEIVKKSKKKRSPITPISRSGVNFLRDVPDLGINEELGGPTSIKSKHNILDNSILSSPCVENKLKQIRKREKLVDDYKEHKLATNTDTNDGEVDGLVDDSSNRISKTGDLECAAGLQNHDEPQTKRIKLEKEIRDLAIKMNIDEEIDDDISFESLVVNDGSDLVEMEHSHNPSTPQTYQAHTQPIYEYMEGQEKIYSQIFNNTDVLNNSNLKPKELQFMKYAKMDFNEWNEQIQEFSKQYQDIFAKVADARISYSKRIESITKHLDEIALQLQKQDKDVNKRQQVVQEYCKKIINEIN